MTGAYQKMSSNERKWSQRAFRDGDEEAILELWKAVYPERQYQREQWMRWWQWMYGDNPSGRGRICLAEHDGKAVGQYAIAPVMMKVGDRSVLGALSFDTMTHPDYRRQGIFETLAKAVYAEAHSDGIDIVHGFPNQFSYPGFMRKLDWFHIDTVRAVIKPLNWRNALSIQIGNGFLLMLGGLAGRLLGGVLFRSSKAPVVEGLTIAEVPRFDERVNDLWARVSHQHQIMVERTKDHLNWRYASVPDMDYLVYVAERAGVVSGYLVLRCMHMNQARVAVIFDILAESEEIAQCLIAETVQRCTRENVDLVYCAGIGGRSLAKAFARNGFRSIPFVRSLRFCAYSSSPSIPKEFLQKPANWYVQMGDSDML